MVSLIAAATILIASMQLFGCAANTPSRPAAISHIVLIKLKDPALASELLLDSNEKLSTISSVATYHAGRHLETGRALVDGDYDVCLSVGFDSTESYAAYLEHPLHLALVERWSQHWEWIRIYDVLDNTP